MRRRRWLEGKSVALSISESEDLLARGLSPEHLNDAFAEVVRTLLALGAQLVYGGDLRERGYTELLFELVARYSLRRGRQRDAVVSVLAYPVHSPLDREALLEAEAKFSGIGLLRYLGRDGKPLTGRQRLVQDPAATPESEWAPFLTAMRRFVADNTQAMVALGGRHTGSRGVMPGVQEEVLLASAKEQPLFIAGGFGGVAHDLATELIGETVQDSASHVLRCHNGLDPVELERLATSPHVDEIALLIVRGLRRRFMRS